MGMLYMGTKDYRFPVNVVFDTGSDELVVISTLNNSLTKIYNPSKSKMS